MIKKPKNDIDLIKSLDNLPHISKEYKTSAKTVKTEKKLNCYFKTNDFYYS